MQVTKSDPPARLSVLLLWGGTILSLVILIALGVYFYFSTTSHHQQQLNALVSELQQEQVTHLDRVLDDVEYTLDFVIAGAVDSLKQRSLEQTKEAISLLNTLYEKNHAHLSDAEMKQMLKDALRGIRFFNGRGYYFITDTNGVSILQPPDPAIEGLSRIDDQDDAGNYIIQGHINAVANDKKSGFYAYRWYTPDNNHKMADKIAFFELFEPYGWVVGSGDYLYSFEDDLQPKILDYIRNIRFGQSGYVALGTTDGVLLANGNSPQYEGKHYLDYSDPLVRLGAAKVMEAARVGGGLVSYDWYRKGSDVPSQKLTLIRVLPKRNWILMAATFNDELEQLIADQSQHLEQEISADLINMLIILSLFGIFSFVITQAFNRWLSCQFKQYKDDLDRQHAEMTDIAKSLELSGRVMESALEGIIVCDADGRILKANEAFTGITGYQESEVIGKSPALLASGKHDSDFFKQMWTQLVAEGSWRGEIWNKRKNGEVYPELLSISAHKDDEGNILNYIATYNDISKRKAAEDQLRHLAETDSLTGLANRRTLISRLNHDLAVVRRYEAPKIGLVFVDLDYFKPINDNYGHDVGDMVLIEIAKRLVSSLRESDLACRLGGDEFVVVLKLGKEEGIKHLKILCERLLNELLKPVSVLSLDLDISCSMGVVLNTDATKDAFSLMKAADTALYEAKGSGRGRMVFYSEKE